MLWLQHFWMLRAPEISPLPNPEPAHLMCSALMESVTFSWIQAQINLSEKTNLARGTTQAGLMPPADPSTGLLLGAGGKRQSSSWHCRDRDLFFLEKKKKGGGKGVKKGPVFAANTCNLLQPLSDKTVLP